MEWLIGVAVLVLIGFLQELDLLGEAIGLVIIVGNIIYLPSLIGSIFV